MRATDRMKPGQQGSITLKSNGKVLDSTSTACLDYWLVTFNKAQTNTFLGAMKYPRHPPIAGRGAHLIYNKNKYTVDAVVFEYGSPGCIHLYLSDGWRPDGETALSMVDQLRQARANRESREWAERDILRGGIKPAAE